MTGDQITFEKIFVEDNKTLLNFSASQQIHIIFLSLHVIFSFIRMMYAITSIELSPNPPKRLELRYNRSMKSMTKRKIQKK